MSDGVDVLGSVAETEAPIVDTAVDTPELSAEHTDDVPAREEGEDKQPKADARLLPKDVQRLLKSLRDADPANASVVKQLNDAFFREQAYQKLGKIEDIQVLKQKYEE